MPKESYLQFGHKVLIINFSSSHRHNAYASHDRSHWNIANQTFYASISIAGSHISHGKQVKGALQLHPGIPGNAAFANPIIVAHCCLRGSCWPQSASQHLKL